MGDVEGALEWAERGVALGFTHHRFLSEHNRFLAPLRGHPKFGILLDRAREKERAFEATVPMLTVDLGYSRRVDRV